MSKVVAALREEITRLARREARKQTEALCKVSAQYRKAIAGLKRQVTALEGRIASLEKQVPQAPVQAAKVDLAKVRFSAKGLRSHRRALAQTSHSAS
jgi:phage shock protein A